MIRIANEIYGKLGFVIQKYQLELLLEDAMRVIINKGRGMGFTQILSLKILLLALLIKSEYIIVSKDRDAANKVIKYIQEFYGIIQELDYDFITKRIGEGSKSELEFTNGSNIKSVSSKPEAIRSAHGFVLWDEAAYHPNDEKLQSAISGCLKPAFPWYVFSTPSEQTGVYYTLWEKVKDISKGGEWKRYGIFYDQCHVPGYQRSVLRERKEMEEQGLLDEWNREYCGKFIDGTTRLFNMELIVEATEKESAAGVSIRSIGIDLGKEVSHSELVGAGKDASRIIRFPKMIGYQLRQEYSTQLKSMIEFSASQPNLDGIYPDATGIGGPLKEILENSPVSHMVKPQTFTSQFKEKLIMFLYTGMNSGKILIPNDRKLKAQLHGLRRTTLDSGSIRYKHEPGVKDDRVWALCLSLIPFMDDNLYLAENMPVVVNNQPRDINEDKFIKLREEMEKNKL